MAFSLTRTGPWPEVRVVAAVGRSKVEHRSHCATSSGVLQVQSHIANSEAELGNSKEESYTAKSPYSNIDDGLMGPVFYHHPSDLFMDRQADLDSHES